MAEHVGVGTGTEHSLALRSSAAVRRWFWMAAIVLGGAQTWMSRHTLSTHDSVSYLDIADAYLRADWQAALNAHWSPLYSWLLALTLGLIEPTPYWELATVKLVNFVVYLGALVAFDFFLRALIAHVDGELERSERLGFLRVPEWVWIVSGYGLFLWSSLKWTSLYSDTPDLCTSVFVYLAAGILLRARSGMDRWINFVLLGVVVGLAYLSKTALLPIGAVFLAAGLLTAGGFRRALPRVLVAALALAVVVAPFVAALSAKEGHFTLGEAGRYVYVVFVNPGVPKRDLLHWQGEQTEFGTPEHTTRQIHESPAAFEFATPIAGSYPPWYDPSYWHAGIKIRFDVLRQIKMLVKNLVFAWDTFLAALVFGYLALLVGGGGRLRPSLAGLGANAVILVPAVVGVGVYLLATDFPASDISTQPAMRYIAPFAVLLFAGVLSSVGLPDSKQSLRWLSGITTAAVTVVVASFLASLMQDRLKNPRIHRDHVDWEITTHLAALGIGPGDEIANMGAGTADPLYWARLAGVRIVAEIADERDFWRRTPQTRADVLRAVEATGVKAVVAVKNPGKPDWAVEEGWQKYGERNVYVYRFY